MNQRSPREPNWMDVIYKLADPAHFWGFAKYVMLLLLLVYSVNQNRQGLVLSALGVQALSQGIVHAKKYLGKPISSKDSTCHLPERDP